MHAMPTASQAMILRSTEGSDHFLARRLYSSVPHVPPGKSESKNKQPPQTAESMPTFQKGKPGHHSCPGTTPQQVILQGFRGNMFYDQETRRFRWHIISQNNNVSDDILTATAIDYESPEENPPPTQISSKPKKLLSRRDEMSGRSTAADDRSIFEQYGVDEKSYKRLEELGFRRRFIAAPSKVSSTQRFSTPIAPKFESTENPSNPIMHHTVRLHIPHGSTTNYEGPHSDGDECADEHTVSEKTLSLIDDIKQKVGYDKRIFPAMYMRKSYPMEQPLSMCFSLRNDNLSHATVKKWIENEIGAKVAAIRYDPVSVRAGVHLGIGSRWVVTMTTLEDCRKLLHKGLEVDGEKVMVRWLDDIFVCEFDAYKIHCQEQSRAELRKKNRKPKSELT